MEIPIQWNPPKTDTTGTKTFVRYSAVSFAQGSVTDHANLPIAANCDRMRQEDNEIDKIDYIY